MVNAHCFVPQKSAALTADRTWFDRSVCLHTLRANISSAQRLTHAAVVSNVPYSIGAADDEAKQ